MTSPVTSSDFLSEMEHSLQGFSSNDSKEVLNASMTLNSTGKNSSEQLTEVNLSDILGPKRSPFFLPVTTVYILIFVIGLSGNVLTCAVIAKHKKMRNPTNLYLVSLAVSDLLVLLFGMPLEIYDLWQNYPFPFGEGGCYFKTFLFETVCFASILNVTALSVERYIAVVHPLKTRYLSTNQHAKRVITVVWVVSMICAIPNTLLHGIFYVPERMEESAICTVLKPLWIYNMIMQITTVCFYFVPMMIISILYLVMGLHLGRERRQTSGKLGKNCSSHTRMKINVENGRRRQVIKMLSIVVAVFGLCWAPFHIERLLWSSISQWTDLMHNIYQYVHILSGVLFYLSSAVNPIIYSLLSTRFRESFRELVCSHTEDNSSVRDSPPFSKILLDSSISGSRVRAEGKDSNAFPLLRHNMSLSMDTELLTCACKETTCKTSVF